MRVFVWTPAYVAGREHVGMVRVQSLLARRLRPHLPGVEIVSGLVVDHAAERFASEVADIGREFDVFRPAVPPEFGTTWGIRKPTNYATALAGEAGCTHVLRVIQDTFVTDAGRFAAHVGGALPTPGEWVAAHVHHWTPAGGGHRRWCEAMGLPFRPFLDYPNGAVMLAPLTTWQRFYLTLPAGIHHWWDDVMMGEAMLAAGAGIIDIPHPWQHRHGCPAAESAEVYRRHLAEMIDQSQ